MATRGPNTTIYERILQDVLEGSMPPGHFVHETELANRYGVSRTPIREALGALEYSGIIQRERGGIRVVEPSPVEILHIYDVKTALEAEAGRAAALNRTEVDLSVLQHLLEATEAVQGDGDAAVSHLNTRFHHAVREATHNRVLTEILDRLDINLHRFRESTISHPGRRDVVLVEHRQLFDAIKSGDGEAAGAIARAHTQEARAIRLAQYSEGLSGRTSSSG